MEELISGGSVIGMKFKIRLNIYVKKKYNIRRLNRQFVSTVFNSSKDWS